MKARPLGGARRGSKSEGEAGLDRAPPKPACPSAADPALRRVSNSERGGWALLGRLLIWAMRNS
jgi:hypothetical protein